MSDTIQIKAGIFRQTMPALSPRELGFCTDRDGGSLYIGADAGNVLLASANHTAKAIPNQAAAQANLPAGVDLAAVITAFNGLLAAMRAAGLMKAGEST